MMRIAVLLAALLVGMAVFGVAAQDIPAAEQVATLSVGDGGLVAYVSGGEFLVVADGTQLQLYNLSDLANPRDAASLPVDDVPVALAATADFALVALPTATSPDELLVIAPDRYSRGGFGIVNFLDVPDNPRRIVLSPNNRWALVYGDGGYVTMALSAADDIEVSAPVDTGDSPVVDAALTDQHILLIREGTGRLEQQSLSTNRRMLTRPQSLDLEGNATALGISPDGTLGAVALDDNRVMLFDPTTLDSLATLPMEDGPARDVRFITAGERRYLALLIENRPAVMLLDVTDPQNVPLPGSVGVGDGTIRAFTTYGEFLALSRGDAVLVFRITQ